MLPESKFVTSSPTPMSLRPYTMPAHAPNPAPNACVRFIRKLARPAGFQQSHNLILFILFAGALLGFILDRTPYLVLSKGLKPGGEAFWYSQPLFHTGLILHLSCILPSGALATLQFLPVLLNKALLFHRLNGYLIILLLLLSNVGALMIARRAFGGTLASQSGVATLALATTTSATLSYYHIKRLQIHLHRAWMLRCWFYAGAIVTMRIINAISAPIISRIGSYSAIVPCAEIAFALNRTLARAYPACAADPIRGLAVVHANSLTPASALEAGAAASVGFGMALWMALTIHAVGVEVYLALAPAETERLRQVSYQRRLERGFADQDQDLSQLVERRGGEGRFASKETGLPLAKSRTRGSSVGDLSPSDSSVLGRGLRW
ncbi:hypothetical protein LTR08_002653 [Meristemomyces frigidus]|nr:hypothetical protein LTR08_002653 [Meristemomyces frigidus]